MLGYSGQMLVQMDNMVLFTVEALQSGHGETLQSVRSQGALQFVVIKEIKSVKTNLLSSDYQVNTFIWGQLKTSTSFYCRTCGVSRSKTDGMYSILIEV